jgi:hypothetical protein
MQLSAARALLLALHWVASVSASAPSSCAKYGEFEGSEDSTLWKAGLAFQSSGLERMPSDGRLPVGHQGGKMLMVDLRSDAAPVVHDLNISGIPADFSFHPHGLHLDNVTQRLFAVCHSKTVPLKGQRAAEESVAVFDIVQPAAGASSPLPALRYAYALKSPLFQYHNASLVWFLNDVTVVDGANELYVTQLGPLEKNMSDEKTFFRCTWDERKARSDGRLPAVCAVAYVDADGSRPASYGLNGINIDGDSKRLFVNNMYGGELWVFDRKPDGSLTRVDTIGLPGIIDNVERDHASGDLTGGMFVNHMVPSDTRGGNILVKCTDKQANTYAKPVVAEIDTSPKYPCPPTHFPCPAMRQPKYQVSTSLTYGNWTILGSPADSGLVICHRSSK